MIFKKFEGRTDIQKQFSFTKVNIGSQTDKLITRGTVFNSPQNTLFFSLKKSGIRLSLNKYMFIDKT